MKKFVELFAVLLLNISCVTMKENFCPYKIVDSCIAIGTNKNTDEYALAYLTIFNDSTKEINGVVVSLELADSLAITTKIPVCIPSNETQTITVNLDEYLLDTETDDLQIEQCYIKRIEYTDETNWNDIMGRYMTIDD